MITITKTWKLLDNPQMVEVHGTGPRGGSVEWTVTFDLDNRIKLGYNYAPEKGLHLPHLIPQEVKEAARKEYLGYAHE